MSNKRPVAPETIYLQLEHDGEMATDIHEATWCQDRINLSDVVYVRKNKTKSNKVAP